MTFSVLGMEISWQNTFELTVGKIVCYKTVQLATPQNIWKDK